MLQVKEFQQDSVIFRDKKEFENKLRQLVEDGASKVQIISDYDSTLTKSIVDEKPTLHSIDIFSRCKTLSQRYRDGCATLAVKYEPLVNKPQQTPSEKQVVYDQWWLDHEVLTAGENLTVMDLQEATDTINTPLREGCTQMLALLLKHQVPLVVVSAGIGEVIAHVLQDFKPKIISNYMRIDENGRFLGFTKPTVSVYNKHKVPLPIEDTRHNVILLGDSLGDCNMADNVLGTKTLLKIGFFTGTDDEKLEQYRSCYDVVLVNDQTMHTLISLLQMIVGPA